MRTRSTGERTLALFFLGLVAFTPPVLTIFSVAEDWFGIPALFLYLMVAWAGLILLMGLSAAGGEESGHTPQPRGELRPGDQ